MTDLTAIRRTLGQGPYQGYAYSYPHKSAYRPLTPAMPLREIWREERKDRIGLYLHIPFCEMRCGFCNLLTAANLGTDAVEAYLAALTRQVESVAGEIGEVRPLNLTLGGGTPTYLEPPQLARVFDLLAARLGCDASVPVCVETSPKTATAERLDLLAERGVQRISIGVQSFIDAECKALGRPQHAADAAAAIDRIRARPFQRLNIDLIYGSAAQTPESFARSLRQALSWWPEEIFLYPLYVRPLTGLDGRAANWDDHRLTLYRTGRDLLRAEGYRQVSMRMFQKGDAGLATGRADGEAGEVEDSLLGLGCGARSRTATLHYSSAYAVGRAAVLSILRDYCARDRAAFATADYGIALDREEQMRRTVVKSVLQSDGLDLAAFDARFGVTAFDHAAELAGLVELGILAMADGRLVPTSSGLERADAIGPLLYSPTILARMKAFELA